MSDIPSYAYTPKPCCRCHKNPIAHNGYCHECDPAPVVDDVMACCDADTVVSVGWQTEKRLADGKTLTVVHRRNYCKDHLPKPVEGGVRCLSFNR